MSKCVFYVKLSLFLMFALVIRLNSQTTNHIASTAKDIQPLLIGTQVPDVQLFDIDSKSVNLMHIVTQTPAIIIFYRGGWCPFCNLQMGQIQNIVPDITNLGFQIIAISPDQPEELKKSIEKNELSYTLLSDSKMEAARCFGIAFRVADSVIKRYEKLNMDLEMSSGEKHHLLPVPSVFITGSDGIIKFEYVNPNYKIRIDPDVLLAAAKSSLKQ
jgi:peroxiredoxin